MSDNADDGYEVTDKFTVRLKLVNYDGGDTPVIAVRETYQHAGADDGSLHHAIGDAVACALLRLFNHASNDALSALHDGFTAVIEEQMHENDQADLGRLTLIRQRAAKQPEQPEQP